MDSKQLAHLIRARIAEHGPMTLPEIQERATSKGHDAQLVLSALSILGRFKDITVKVKDNTNHYSIRQVNTVSPVDRYRPTQEVRDRMERESKDFWEHSPLVSDEERVCYYASMKDKNHYKTCPSTSCAHWRWMLMNRDERAMVEVERVREVVKMI